MSDRNTSQADLPDGQPSYTVRDQAHVASLLKLFQEQGKLPWENALKKSEHCKLSVREAFRGVKQLCRA